jgi:hypothetical protein
MAAVAALDFAAIRAIFSMATTFEIGLQALINAIPIGLVLSFGLLRMVATPGKSRAFCVGFLIGGAIAMTTSVWAALTPAGSARTTAGAPNKILHGSGIWHLWNSYFLFATNRLESLGIDVRSFAPRSLHDPGIGYIIATGLMAFLPQLTVALVGGLVARAILAPFSTSLRPSTEPAK